MHCVQVFALGNGNPGRLANLGKSFEIIRDDRLFEPRDIIRFKRVGHRNGLIWCHGVIGVDHECDIRPDQPANGLDAC